VVGGALRVASTLGLVLLPALLSAGNDEAKDALAPPVRTLCKEVAECRPSCDGVDADEDRRVYAPVAHFPGSFTAPRAQEAIVSLFPCGEAFTERQAGLTALLRKSPSGWTTVTTIEDAVTQDECRLVESTGRQLLVCQVSVGPQQGIVTAALCVLSASEGRLVNTCPLRVTDVTASGCFPDASGQGARHTWAADIKSWTPATVAGSPGARVEVSLASVSVPAGENMDPACDRAIQRLQKATPEVVSLDLAFDGPALSLIPASRRVAARFPWIFDTP